MKENASYQVRSNRTTFEMRAGRGHPMSLIPLIKRESTSRRRSPVIEGRLPRAFGIYPDLVSSPRQV